MGENVERRFDDLARSLAQGRTRKSVLKAGVGAIGMAVAAALPGRARADQPQGNDDCAHFCTSVFPPGPARGDCISAAAHGEGICFECGPAAIQPPVRVLCVDLCCAVGEICCNDHCVNPATACTGGHVFNVATCSCVCPTGTTECAGICVNTQTDTHNCGTCGHACVDGQLCVNGSCVCPTGTVLCNNTCVTTCTAPKVLNPTTCLCECPTGTTTCGTTCCAAGEVCTNGSCGPPPHPECEGATCATFKSCSSSNPVCVCVTSCGGNSPFCTPGSTVCAGLVACGAGCTCPAGSTCAVNTCCGTPVCIPDSLSTQCPSGTGTATATFTPFTAFGGGPTVGGI